MNELDQVVLSLRLLLLLAAFTGVWFLGWRRHRLDAFRQNLFEIRSELFDCARDGELEFTDPAYTNLRMMINSLIRFGHRLSLQRLIIIAFFAPMPPRELSAYHRWKESVDATPGLETREHLKALHGRVMLQMITYLISTSLITLFSLGVAFCVFQVLVSVKHVSASTST